jgi:hypothetical protein
MPAGGANSSPFRVITRGRKTGLREGFEVMKRPLSRSELGLAVQFDLRVPGRIYDVTLASSLQRTRKQGRLEE